MAKNRSVREKKVLESRVRGMLSRKPGTGPGICKGEERAWKVKEVRGHHRSG